MFSCPLVQTPNPQTWRNNKMEGIMRPTRQDNQDIKAYIRDVLGPATGKRMSVS